MKSVLKELVGAASIPVILTMLKEKDSYGYEIVQTVKQLSHGGISWTEASIYPVLKKLENEGMIKSYWRVVHDDRPRKYYSILAEGSRQLDLNKEEWGHMFNLFSHFWGSPDPGKAI